VKLITLLVEFKQMKLAVLATAIFNNLLFHKAKLSTTIYYDLNILKIGRVFQSVVTMNGGFPYPCASSKASERRCLRYPPRIQMAPSISRGRSQQTQTLSPLQSTSIQPHQYNHIIQGLGKSGYCGILHGLA
jgi:hypothetical protein